MAKNKDEEKKSLSRREFLKDTGMVVGGAALTMGALSLAGCASPEAETTTVTASGTTKTTTVTGPGSTVTVTGPGRPDPTLEWDADIIVVGAGGAGMMAAMTAADEGAKVIHIEKEADTDGSWSVSGSTTTGAMTKMQVRDGIYGDSPALFYSDILKSSPVANAIELCDPGVLRLYCESTGEVCDWLNSLGAYGPEGGKTRPGMYSEEWTLDRSYFPAPGFHVRSAVRAEYMKRVDRGDVKLLLNTKVTHLIQEEGRVVGVKAKGGDGVERDYKAGVAVLCTGGYGGNVEWLKKYRFPGVEHVVSAAPPFITGDGHIMCEEIGVKLVNMYPYGKELPYLGAVPDPDNPGTAIANVNCSMYPGAIWVGTNGKRLGNEHAIPYSQEWKEIMANAPGMVVIVILDKKIKDENKSILTPFFSTPARSWEWFEEKAEEGVIIKKANTIEELATLLGVDSQTLKNTITTYNGYVEAGEDLEFGRKELVYKIENPPFYAIKTYPTALMGAGGPACNVKQQVLFDAHDKVVPGLYVGGELCGYMLLHSTGAGVMGAIAYGKQAGKMAAQEALYRRF